MTASEYQDLVTAADDLINYLLEQENSAGAELDMLRLLRSRIETKRVDELNDPSPQS
jgi:hypothetical protein